MVSKVRDPRGLVGIDDIDETQDFTMEDVTHQFGGGDVDTLIDESVGANLGEEIFLVNDSPALKGSELGQIRNEFQVYNPAAQYGVARRSVVLSFGDGNHITCVRDCGKCGVVGKCNGLIQDSIAKIGLIGAAAKKKAKKKAKKGGSPFSAFQVFPKGGLGSFGNFVFFIVVVGGIILLSKPISSAISSYADAGIGTYKKWKEVKLLGTR